MLLMPWLLMDGFVVRTRRVMTLQTLQQILAGFDNRVKLSMPAEIFSGSKKIGIQEGHL